MSDEWDAVSYVISSRYRVNVLERLHEGPTTPSIIASETEYSISHVSRALQELQDDDLVDLLVSKERRKGRVYGLTDQGERVIERIEAENMT